MSRRRCPAASGTWSLIGSDQIRTGLQSFGLARFLHANRYPPPDQVRGRLSLENALNIKRRSPTASIVQRDSVLAHHRVRCRLSPPIPVRRYFDADISTWNNALALEFRVSAPRYFASADRRT